MLLYGLQCWTQNKYQISRKVQETDREHTDDITEELGIKCTSTIIKKLSKEVTRKPESLSRSCCININRRLEDARDVLQKMEQF